MSSISTTPRTAPPAQEHPRDLYRRGLIAAHYPEVNTLLAGLPDGDMRWAGRMPAGVSPEGITDAHPATPDAETGEGTPGAGSSSLPRDPVSLRRRLAALTPSDRAGLLGELVRQQTAGIPGLGTAESVADQEHFADWGFSSFTALQLRNELLGNALEEELENGLDESPPQDGK